MDGIRRRKLEFRRLAPNPANEISRVTSPIWQSLRKRIWADPKAELCLTTVGQLTGELANDHLEKVKMTHDAYFYSMQLTTNIVEQDMDGVFGRYLSTVHLNRYQWFFNGLDYLQIISIDESNIQEMIALVNRIYGNGHYIKQRSRLRICKFTKAMKHRSIKISAILESFTILNLTQRPTIDSSTLYKIISYMRQMLELPIPNRHCIQDIRLQNYIIRVLQYFVQALTRQVTDIIPLLNNGLFGKIIKKLFECTKLIRENTSFGQHNIVEIEFIQKLVTSLIANVANRTRFNISS